MSKFIIFPSSIRKQLLFPNRHFRSSTRESSTTSNKGDGKKLYENDSQLPDSVPISLKPKPSKKSQSSKSILDKMIPGDKAQTLPRGPKPRKFPNTDDAGLPLLTPKDCNARVLFSSKMLNLLEAHPELVDRIIFSDEGNFNLTPLPRSAREEDAGMIKSFHSDAISRYGESKRVPQIVWCGMTTKYILGPYFFNSYITDRTYLKMLRTFLIPQLKALGSEVHNGRGIIGPWWFQQDGNPPHRTRPVLSYLQDVFGPRLISYGAGFSWPPRSQDLTPLDYFLWDHLKERLQDNCCPIQDLSTTSAFRKSLIDQIDDVDEDVIRRVVIQFQKRLELCIDANGGRFDFKGDEDKDH